MDRFVNVGDLERYAVVLDNGHKYIPWVALAEVPTADVAAVLAAIIEGYPEDQFPDLSNVRFLLQGGNLNGDAKWIGPEGIITSVARKCSCCGYIRAADLYCSHCGAKMEKRRNG